MPTPGPIRGPLAKLCKHQDQNNPQSGNKFRFLGPLPGLPVSSPSKPPAISAKRGHRPHASGTALEIKSKALNFLNRSNLDNADDNNR